MLISYPILASANVSDDEDQYLKNVLASYVLNDKVRYPVTEVRTPTGPIHRWHGGIHMRGNGEPVRAIADGTVVAYRFAPARETYEGLGDYDTSFVLIHHQTETGENTKVGFYSLYMHLANRQDLYADRYTQLPDWMKQAGPSTAVRKPNKRVWRKDVIGFAGQHYNREAWHFEIFTTDQAFNAFWRDSLFKDEGNGSDDFFGDAHFVIPPGQRFAATHPQANTDHGAHRIDFDTHGHHYDLLRGQDGTNTESLYVSVKLHKGNRIATTWRFDSPKDRFVQVGSAVEQPDYEYELYRLATALYPDCPSAGYEWLRFGRVLGPDRTTHNENWQLVRYAPDGVGYVDLAPDRVVKLSDADFPFWQGWDKRIQGQLVNPDDGVCGDESVIELIRANDDASATTLRHLICRHPSEWDASDLAARYAAMRAPDQPLHDDAQWAKFQSHVQKLAFWAEAGLPERSVWHFHPLQFIRHFRNCHWLSRGELAQCMPRESHVVPAHMDWGTAYARSGEHYVELNRMVLKYFGYCKYRLINLLAQIYIETGILSVLREYHLGNGKPYGPFYGRGFLQITWAGNYAAYGDFKNVPDQSGPSSYADPRLTSTSSHPKDLGGGSMIWAPRYDPECLIADRDHRVDASGWYWIAKHFAGRLNMNRVADLPLTPVVIGYASWLINGGGNGYAARQQFAKFLINVLLDNPLQRGLVQFSYPPFNAALHHHFPPTDVPYTRSTSVNYEPQIPEDN